MIFSVVTSKVQVIKEKTNWASKLKTFVLQRTLSKSEKTGENIYRSYIW